MPCFLGIDYGTKRIGLAVSNAEATIALPLATLQAGGDLPKNAAAVAAQASEHNVDEFVVGLPLNMDDTEGDQAKLTRAFGAELARMTGLPVHYQDERLSSAGAEELLRPAELTRKKKKARLDRIAAQVMLQSFLDERSGYLGK